MAKVSTAGASHAAAGGGGRRVPSVTTQIFIGLVLGIAIGYIWPGFGVALKPLADAFKFTGYVMMFAPVGVMAAIAATVGGKGLGILFTLAGIPSRPASRWS